MVGQINIDPAMPHAFLSYTRFDDDFLDGGISSLRLALEKAVQARTGEPFRIFQDVDDIQPGDIWRKKLDQAIQAAQLFIPILTPNFFTSDFCRREAKAFLDYEARTGRGDLVLPIYLIDADRMDDETQRNADDIARQLHDRQYSDWRPLRFKLQAEDTRARIYDLAGGIASAIARTNDVIKGPEVPTKDVEAELSALKDKIAERDRIIEGERIRNERLEAEITERKDEIGQLAEEKATFLGQLEEQTAENPEADTSRKLRARLSKLEQAFKKEHAKAQALAKELEESKDEIQQFSIERAMLESDVEDTKKLKDRLQHLEEDLAEERKAAKGDLQDAQQNEEQLRKEVRRLAARNETFETDDDATVGSRAGDNSEINSARKGIATSLDRLRFVLLSPRLIQVSGLSVLVIMLGVGMWKTLPAGWSPSGLSTGETFRDCDVCPQMVVIPAGTFLMGSPEGRGDDDERPQRKVAITSPFALGKYEVTFADWDACVAAGGCVHRPDDLGWGRENRPVVNVNWKDSQQYVTWLSEKTNKKYKLPNEARWEYAARAGTTTAYYWGDFIGENNANCNSCGSVWDGRKTAPVGSFDPNFFGLYDMHGNVWEWTQDVRNDNPNLRVTRGGGWTGNPKSIRSANRYGYSLGAGINSLGFRVLREGRN